MRVHPVSVAPMVLAALLLGGPIPSLARDNDHERRDAVRRASEAGEVLPLAEILQRIRPKISGDITGIDVEREHGRWRYELRVIDRSGRVLEILVDARSGEIEGVEEQ